jgi:hypothetical protein
MHPMQKYAKLYSIAWNNRFLVWVNKESYYMACDKITFTNLSGIGFFGI